MFPSARLARTSYMSWAKTSIGKAGIGAGGAGGTGGGGGVQQGPEQGQGQGRIGQRRRLSLRPRP